MVNSLSPAYMQINYHSSLAPHTMTIPTLMWNDVPSVGSSGTFDTWDSNGVDAAEMAEDLVDVMLPFFNSFVTFDNFVIFTKPVDPGPSYPQTGQSFTSKVGTNPSASWWPTVQTSIVARSTGFGICKLVLLDSVSGDDYLPERVPSAPMLALLNVWFNDANGWSARDNGQPINFIKATQTLNEKLRKEYRYT